MALSEWAEAMRARSIEISEVPLSQAEILSRQTIRGLAGQDLDAVVFSLKRGQAPIPERGGSGFVIGPDPTEGLESTVSQTGLIYGQKITSAIRQTSTTLGGAVGAALKPTPKP